MTLLLSSRTLRISEMDRRFYEKVRDLSGEEIDLCYQCGICSGSCPMASEMDILPSTLIRLVQLGQTEVLESETIWLCSSCFTCSVRCPRGLDVAKVMEALRLIILRRGIYKLDLRKIKDIDKYPQIALVGASRKLTG